jgi:hypothetical protein
MRKDSEFFVFDKLVDQSTGKIRFNIGLIGFVLEKGNRDRGYLTWEVVVVRGKVVPPTTIAENEKKDKNEKHLDHRFLIT